jgi:hypothetical protein
MKPFQYRLVPAVALLFTAIALVSCHDPGISPNPAAIDGDFFPLKDGKQWQYQYAYFTTDKDSTEVSSESKLITIGGDITIDDKVYKQFVDGDGNLLKLVRQEGTRFYGRKHELYGITHEYLFLDTSIPVGGSWSYIKDGGLSKTEYIVKAVHETHKINNNTFRNVLEIEVNYYELDENQNMTFKFTASHFYTDGMGETYAFYPAPANNNETDLNISLVGYN